MQMHTYNNFRGSYPKKISILKTCSSILHQRRNRQFFLYSRFKLTSIRWILDNRVWLCCSMTATKSTLIYYYTIEIEENFDVLEVEFVDVCYYCRWYFSAFAHCYLCRVYIISLLSENLLGRKTGNRRFIMVIGKIHLVAAQQRMLLI
jgi:hypothetical protein